MTPEAEVLKTIVFELESHDIPYMVVGSFATGLWGRPRSTHDVDVLIDVASEAASDFSTLFAQALKTNFYADAEFMRESIQRRSMFNVIHFDSSFKADVWILKEDEYEQVAFVRRVRRRFFGADGFDAFVASPEDTIFSKLRWYQQKLNGNAIFSMLLT